ncbi:CidB/LrgB family autolysis modulator [Alistipes sp. An54]|uniref:LrgB family protein n=1 Tax=Alistipes sp. An54 TaxID=1965645 RepID=UPI000B36927D|nr:LrgB family protein [Alistipes sp. An54]OUN77196.1 CidB/LrgB family autolysis modulator [Alistipes sp. An54]
MLDFQFLRSDLFLLTLTVGLYCLGTLIYRRSHMPLLHPVLLTFVSVIVFLRCAGIDYPRYQEATGILNFALGLSVVALGYLLYEQLERLRSSLMPVAVATLAGCVVGGLSVVYIAEAFGVERQILNSLAPKSVTVPIAVSVAGPLGGNVSITSVVVFCVGIFGSIFGEWILRHCGVRDPEARGFALGAAAHGIGTARAIEIGVVEGALSGLAMALMGLATALLVPLMERYLY